MEAPKAAPVKHHTHVHPFWASVLWLLGFPLVGVLSAGSARWGEVWFLKRELQAEAALASVEYHEPETLIAQQTALLNAAAPVCARNPGGGMSCEPASADFDVEPVEPVITDLRVAAAYLESRTVLEAARGPFIAAVVAYALASLATVLTLLLGSRRG